MPKTKSEIDKQLFYRKHGSDQFWLVYIGLPMICCFMPWNLAFRLLKWISHREKILSKRTASAFLIASRYCEINDIRKWCSEFKLWFLIDRVDPLLQMMRRDATWLAKYVDHEGEWPKINQSIMFVGTHWGNAWWAQVAMRLYSGTTSVIYRPIPRQNSWLKDYYFNFIIKRICKIPGYNGISTGKGFRKRLDDRVKSSIHFLNTFDIPPEPKHITSKTQLCGKQAKIVTGLLDEAAKRNIKFAPYVMGTNMQSGRRFLKVGPLFEANEKDKLIRYMVEEFNQLLTEQSTGWHLWPQADAFFVKK